MAVVETAIFFIIKIVIGLVLIGSSAYYGMHLFDRYTKHVEEWEELKKGNVAVGIFFSALIIAHMIFVLPRINDIIFLLAPNINYILVGIAIANYIIATILSTIVLYFAFITIDQISEEIEELAEIEKGNIAIALITSITLIFIALGLSSSFELLFKELWLFERMII